MPLLAGSASSSFRHASSPPARRRSPRSEIGLVAGGKGLPNPVRPPRLFLSRTTSRHSGHFSRRAELQRYAQLIYSTDRELLPRI